MALLDVHTASASGSYEIVKDPSRGVNYAFTSNLNKLVSKAIHSLKRLSSNGLCNTSESVGFSFMKFH